MGIALKDQNAFDVHGFPTGRICDLLAATLDDFGFQWHSPDDRRRVNGTVRLARPYHCLFFCSRLLRRTGGGRLGRTCNPY